MVSVTISLVGVDIGQFTVHQRLWGSLRRCDRHAAGTGRDRTHRRDVAAAGSSRGPAPVGDGLADPAGKFQQFGMAGLAAQYADRPGTWLLQTET